MQPAEAKLNDLLAIPATLYHFAPTKKDSPRRKAVYICPTTIVGDKVLRQIFGCPRQCTDIHMSPS